MQYHTQGMASFPCSMCGVTIFLPSLVLLDKIANEKPVYCFHGHQSFPKLLTGNTGEAESTEKLEEVGSAPTANAARKYNDDPELPHLDRCPTCGGFYKNLTAHELRAHNSTFREQWMGKLRKTAKRKRLARKSAAAKGAKGNGRKAK